LIIEAKELRKVYSVSKHREGLLGGIQDLFAPVREKKEAVKGIDLAIREGEAVGYVGPNGSGKSTTIKMLTGVLTPSGGQVLVNGLDPMKQRKRNARQIGVVFGQKSQLWWDLAIKQSFELFQHIYKIPAQTFRTNKDMMMELLALSEFEHTPVRQLSLGQRMRAEIACAFFHDPKIVFLDEPTIGLDVVAKEKIRSFIREINKDKKTTVIITSHDMDDIGQVCNRLVLINQGEIILDDSLHNFRKKYGNDRMLTVEMDEIPECVEIPGGEVVARENNNVTILFDNGRVTATQMIKALSEKYPVLDCKLEEPRIEHLIRDIYQSRGQSI